MAQAQKILQRHKRHNRLRERIRGSTAYPRLVIYRSLKYHYAQLVDDVTGKTLLGVTDRASKTKSSKKTDRAKQAGLELAKKAVAKGITHCVFDRAGYKYHGRVKAIAEGAREGGLQL